METINSGVDSYQKIQSLFQGISGQINTVVKPSSENLEAIKLIRSLNDEKKNDIYSPIIEHELQYLNKAIKVLQDNELLAMKFGGMSMDAASNVAFLLKQRAAEKVVHDILDDELTKDDFLKKQTYTVKKGAF